MSPVLTAHPTEVQRKSLLDAELAIAELLAQREGLFEERELERNATMLRTRITQLWQTRLLRYRKLTVRDEIENALSYYRTTFLREIPRLYAEVEHHLGEAAPSFFRMGNWIGGDRDGNPNVDGETLDVAMRRQCETALDYYLGELHHLGAELSVSEMLVGCSPDLTASGRILEGRQPTPTGRTLSSCHSGRFGSARRDPHDADRSGRELINLKCRSSALRILGRGRRRPPHDGLLAQRSPWRGSRRVSPRAA